MKVRDSVVFFLTQIFVIVSVIVIIGWPFKKIEVLAGNINFEWIATHRVETFIISLFGMILSTTGFILVVKSFSKRLKVLPKKSV